LYKKVLQGHYVNIVLYISMGRWPEENQNKRTGHRSVCTVDIKKKRKKERNRQEKRKENRKQKEE